MHVKWKLSPRIIALVFILNRDHFPTKALKSSADYDFIFNNSHITLTKQLPFYALISAIMRFNSKCICNHPQNNHKKSLPYNLHCKSRPVPIRARFETISLASLLPRVTQFIDTN